MPKKQPRLARALLVPILLVTLGSSPISASTTTAPLASPQDNTTTSVAVKWAEINDTTTERMWPSVMTTTASDNSSMNAPKDIKECLARYNIRLCEQFFSDLGANLLQEWLTNLLAGEKWTILATVAVILLVVSVVLNVVCKIVC